MNLIQMIHIGALSLDAAQDVFDGEIQKLHRGESSPDWATTLEFSPHEAKAYVHGATLADLVKLRYEGWPTTCCRCGQPINREADKWWFVHDEDGIPRIKHTICPKSIAA